MSDLIYKQSERNFRRYEPWIRLFAQGGGKELHLDPKEQTNSLTYSDNLRCAIRTYCELDNEWKSDIDRTQLRELMKLSSVSHDGKNVRLGPKRKTGPSRESGTPHGEPVESLTTHPMPSDVVCEVKRPSEDIVKALCLLLSRQILCGTVIIQDISVSSKAILASLQQHPNYDISTIVQGDSILLF